MLEQDPADSLPLVFEARPGVEFSTRPGRGVRKFTLSAECWSEIVKELEMPLPSQYMNRPVRLHVYCVPYDIKCVSPLLQDDVFSLAICGTSCRMSLRVSSEQRPQETLVVAALSSMRWSSIFLVGSLIPQLQYQQHGVGSHPLQVEFAIQSVLVLLSLIAEFQDSGIG